MEHENECAMLERFGAAAAYLIGQQCQDHPERRRFWYGRDLDDGGRVYMEYRRGVHEG